MALTAHFTKNIHGDWNSLTIPDQAIYTHFKISREKRNMSVECSGPETNIVYLNFEKEGPPDNDQERCEVMRNFTTPLLSEVSKYLCSIARFSIPLHTCYMNDRIESAITLCTFDGLPDPQ